MELFSTRMHNGNEVIFCSKCIFRTVEEKGDLCSVCSQINENLVEQDAERQAFNYMLIRWLAMGLIVAALVAFVGTLIGGGK